MKNQRTIFTIKFWSFKDGETLAFTKSVLEAFDIAEAYLEGLNYKRVSVWYTDSKGKEKLVRVFEKEAA